MTEIPADLRAIIAAGPLTHLATTDPDGRPQVSVVWIGLDGDRLVTAHMGRYRKVRNLQRDPRAVLSFLAPSPPGEFLEWHAVLPATATVTETDEARDVLDRLTKVYLGPDRTFPGATGTGYVVHYAVEKIGGVGPWVPARS